jgi:hypothetical protein
VRHLVNIEFSFVGSPCYFFIDSLVQVYLNKFNYLFQLMSSPFQLTSLIGCYLVNCFFLNFYLIYFSWVRYIFILRAQCVGVHVYNLSNKRRFREQMLYQTNCVGWNFRRSNNMSQTWLLIIEPCLSAMSPHIFILFDTHSAMSICVILIIIWHFIVPHRRQMMFE